MVASVFPDLRESLFLGRIECQRARGLLSRAVETEGAISILETAPSRKPAADQTALLLVVEIGATGKPALELMGFSQRSE